MKQKLLVGLALMAIIMLITSCELENDYQAAPDSIFETTWALTITDSQNITASSILKYDATSYHIVTTYIKGSENVVHTGQGSYTYNMPTVTMVAGSMDQLEILVGTISDGKIYLTNSSYVFERQF